MTKLERKRRLAALERIIVDGVSGMDASDMLGSVKVWFADGKVDWLINVIEEANDLRRELAP